MPEYLGSLVWIFHRILLVIFKKGGPRIVKRSLIPLRTERSIQKKRDDLLIISFVQYKITRINK